MRGSDYGGIPSVYRTKQDWRKYDDICIVLFIAGMVADWGDMTVSLLQSVKPAAGPPYTYRCRRLQQIAAAVTVSTLHPGGDTSCTWLVVGDVGVKKNFDARPFFSEKQYVWSVLSIINKNII